MFTRTLTLATEPSHQIILHFLTRERANEMPEIDSEKGNAARFKDDFGQTAIVAGTMIASDVVTDTAGHHAAGGELHIAKLRAAEIFSKRVQDDAEICALYERTMPKQQHVEGNA